MSVGYVQQRRIGASDGARERYLGLDSGDAIYCEPVLALEIPDQARQVSIENVAYRTVAVLAPHMLQTFAQPAYIRTMHSR